VAAVEVAAAAAAARVVQLAVAAARVVVRAAMEAPSKRDRCCSAAARSDRADRAKVQWLRAPSWSPRAAAVQAALFAFPLARALASAA
jgi:hypothetical protein